MQFTRTCFRVPTESDKSPAPFQRISKTLLSFLWARRPGARSSQLHQLLAFLVASLNKKRQGHVILIEHAPLQTVNMASLWSAHIRGIDKTKIDFVVGKVDFIGFQSGLILCSAKAGE